MMKSLIWTLGVAVLLIGVYADDNPTPTSTTVKPTSSSTEPPKPTTPTTTAKPTTTTAASTTAASTTTTTPAPPPKPFPANEGKWTLEDEKNVTCIMLKGALQVEVVYDQKGKNATAKIDIPMKATSGGNCSQNMITLTWNDNVVSFFFEKNETEPKDNGDVTAGKYALQNITGTLIRDPTVFIDDSSSDKTYKFQILNKAAFQTPLNHSYTCLQQETVKAEDGNSTIRLSDVHIEAFRMIPAGHKEFSAAIECPADDSSDVVPIVVGACLAGLIVIVLVAYLIGRRRSRSRGYQSV